MEKRQGLRAGHDAFSSIAGLVQMGLLEGFHPGISQTPEPFLVKASAVPLLRQGVGLINRSSTAHDLARLSGDFLMHLRTGRNASGAGVEFATDGQHGITQFLGTQTSGLKTAIPLIVRIDGL